MKVLLDINDSKGFHLMEVLKSLPYVKAEQITEAKAQLLSEIKHAVDEMNLIKKGKKEAHDAEDFLNEL